MNNKYLFSIVAPVAILAQATTPFSASGTLQPSAANTVLVQPDALPFPSVMKKGDRNDFVSDLQSVLKSDTSIYPEGLVTGYYGTLTETAVKRLQAKYSLSQTGVVDENTQKIIFPTKVELTVISPNGGETWDKSEVHTISWKAETGPVVLNGRSLIPSASTDQAVSTTSIYPFFPRASIDLIREGDLTYRYHIATADLYQSQYTWKIPSNVSQGSDYRVRISTGGDVPCLYRADIEEGACLLLYPIYSASDVSDEIFSITGTTPPPAEVITRLKAQVAQIESVLNQLILQVQSLRALLESL